MEVGLLIVHLDAVRGETARGTGDHRQLDAPEAPMGVQPASQATGHCHRAEPDVEGLLGARELHHHLVEVERRAPGRPADTRRVDEEVEQHLLAGTRARQQEATARQAGERGLGHRRREAGGHTGVDGVAAGLQHLHRRRGGGRVARRHRDRSGGPRSAHRQIRSTEVEEAGEVGDVVVEVGHGGDHLGRGAQLGTDLGLPFGHHLEVEEALPHLVEHPADLRRCAEGRPAAPPPAHRSARTVLGRRRWPPCRGTSRGAPC